MTDSEKIAALIQDKRLTNAQFCAATNLQPAALSHITSGRSKPSLSILRSIVRGFPDVNPMWLFGDETEMYRAAAPSPSSPAPSSGTAATEGAPPSADILSQGGLFPTEETGEEVPPPLEAPVAAPSLPASEPAGTSAQSVPGPALATGAPASTPATGTGPVIIQQVAAPEQPRRRNIVEIRVFYDDATFEILTRKT